MQREEGKVKVTLKTRVTLCDPGCKPPSSPTTPAHLLPSSISHNPFICTNNKISNLHFQFQASFEIVKTGMADTKPKKSIISLTLN
ncbi:hypothetical protein E1B28_012000 [Marasmius oreades]|uniref:Uncharacterized protein n=1 Tax=Marasmius oreades TaxID=181124 RepID=A0A9P7RQM8_9AGAR|nr:uncharacterized protein E1B28_012000 [Marasmius oreades]KAG7087959.1 hypothetical protein E1B28_012000 [Marasmius oreades]